MQIIPQKIKDVLVLKPKIHNDSRGYFLETFRQDVLDVFLGCAVNFVQDNESFSYKNVLRGLHFQKPPHEQAKLLRVVCGKTLHVVVDIRKSSSSFAQYVAVCLDSDTKKQLFIPRGFAHGFVVLSETAVVSYKVDAFYAAESESGIIFNDADLGINWQVPENRLVMSKKDRELPSFKSVIA